MNTSSNDRALKPIKKGMGPILHEDAGLRSETVWDSIHMI